MAVDAGAIRLRAVSRRFRVLHERNPTLKETLLRRRRVVATELWVLRDVDLDIARGESLGVVGRNGIGKSTTLKLVAGIIPPQSGTIEVGGTVAPLLELGAGFHPDFTGRENVFMQGALYGLGEREVAERFEAIVDFAELAEFIDMPVKTYSSGMFMRLAFAIAAHVDADILLLDEVLAVGDAAFQRKCLGRIFEHRRGGGTLMFVSHDQEAVERVCDRAILLDEGRIVADGTPQEVFLEYNRRLVGAAPVEVEAGRVSDEVASSEGVGTGRVLIQDFRLLGQDGPATRFASGDPFTVEIDVLPTGAVESPVFGIEVHDENQVLLYGTNTRMDAFRLSRLEGPATVTFEVPQLPLLEGSFLLTLHAVSHDESEIFHRLRFCREFQVFQQSPGVGPVTFDATWAVHDRAGVVASPTASAT